MLFQNWIIHTIFLIAHLGKYVSIFSIIALLFIFVKYRRLSKLHIFLVGLITGWVVFYYLGFSLLSVYSLVYDVNNNSIVGMGFVSRFISASTITYILYLLLLVFLSTSYRKISIYHSETTNSLRFWCVSFALYYKPLYYFRFIKNSEKTL